ncbi:glutamate receptor 3.7-like [Papaver somniferum]|uniref:glutamate receptor 3.7-like n=1 Tax=Papaver somniferum TaxID=3469 RepID=UPI000E6F819A|nr:glutamate receptor 3.7-like [Papaver somniferum]
MKFMGNGVFVSVIILVFFQLNGNVKCQTTTAVNVGALFTFDSVIGRVAKVAIEAAVADVNADPSILKRTKLNFIMQDTNCSVFLGSMAAFQLLERDVVAVIGPQSSSVAHMISFIANGLQVPLISFAATDATLSALQFPFFLRTTLSDSHQMAAMADVIDYYNWHEVVAVFVDDDHGRNGISLLDSQLAKRTSKLSHKLALPHGANASVISDLLDKSREIGVRVYVVHVNPDSGLEVFSIAKQLQMMTSDYVWLATDWLSTNLDSSPTVDPNLLQTLQGVVGLRQHTPESSMKKAFYTRWRGLQKNGRVFSSLNAYGLYAYDTVWTVARGIDEFLKEHGNLTFSFSKRLPNMNDSTVQLEKLKIFDGGRILVNKLLETNFTGLTGQVGFDSNRNLVNSSYDVINIDQVSIHRIGYWSRNSGLSVVPPEKLTREQQIKSRVDQKLNNATWPGGKTEKPRGWVIASNEKPLRVGVPNRVSFPDFVTEDQDTHEVKGYCIDVFNAALNLIAYEVPYKFQVFGDGRLNPDYDELVKMVSDDVIDAAIGDITIVTNRTRFADFTQPYAANGLVIVVPIKNMKSSAWVYLKPFTAEMWCVTAGFFLLIGVVIWILEHRINDDFRGSPRRQVITMLLFSFSTLFKTNQEDTVSTLGRMVMMVWLFLLMVITSSYTASLTSILTVQQLSSPITGIDSLITSNQPIGLPGGSFVHKYLTDSLNIYEGRLVSLEDTDDYARALQRGPDDGGVAAIVDELPYIEEFLSQHTDFGIAGHMFTKSGWGFAFKKGSPLAVDMSTAILRLSENGDLQKINEKWFCRTGCLLRKGRRSEPNQLHLVSFWGLFLLCAIFTITCLLIFLFRMVRQYVQYKRKRRQLLAISSSDQTPHSTSGLSRVVYNFFDFIDEKEEAIKKMFKPSINPHPPTNDEIR